MIDAYLDHIKALLDHYVTTPFVLDSTCNLETRPGGQGHLSGSVTFIDGSKLNFSEFLDTTPAGVERLMYTYHYRSAADALILRYDNARHRPPLASAHHKHTPGGTISADPPDLDDVLAEIVSLKGWLS